MKDIILASCNGKQFSKYEKVVAFHIFTNEVVKKLIGVCIDKLSEKNALHGDEYARKIVMGKYLLYNVGEYRVEAQIQDFAKITLWDEKEEQLRIKRSKGIIRR